MLEGVSHVQASGNVGGRNDDAVGFAGMVGIGFKDLAIFPIFLPFGFGGFGIVLWRQVGCHRSRVNLSGIQILPYPQAIAVRGGWWEWGDRFWIPLDFAIVYLHD